ncbi:MAG: ParB/RepB/Spo0J family partition protein [Candidatus Aminicenantia bacterium]
MPTQNKKPLSIERVPLNLIVPNPLQPRSDLGDIGELVNSIREKGVLEPILVRRKRERFEIISGERRFRAAQEAGLKEIPCIEIDVSDNEVLEIALIENLQRKDLTSFEESYGLKLLVELYGYSHKEIAEKIGKSRTSITESISISRIPADIAEKCKELSITSKSILVEIARLKNKEKMMEAIEKIKEGVLDREKIRKMKRERKEKKYKFKFKSENFVLMVSFRKSNVSKEEIISALTSVIERLKSDN